MEIAKKLDLIRDEYGEWTAHNIEIEKGLFTMGKNYVDRASLRSKTYGELIKRFLSVNMRSLKVLDLGCLEGGISIPLAAQVARPVNLPSLYSSPMILTSILNSFRMSSRSVSV